MEDNDVKWTCKKCLKKYKGNQADKVECNDSQCDIKYNMTCIDLDFAGHNFKENQKKVEIEAVFESPEPVPTVTELTVDQWQELLAFGWVDQRNDKHEPPA